MKTQLVATSTASEFSGVFARRFLEALTIQPGEGALYSPGSGWNPDFVQVLSKVDSLCKQHNICKHDMRHLTHVAKNAFIISDYIQTFPSFTSSDNYAAIINDHMLLFPSLTHDIGYGVQGAIVKNAEIKDHPRRGVIALEKYRRAHRIEIPEEHLSLFYTTIGGDIKEMLSTAQTLSQADNPLSPQILFPLIVMAADKLDYFRHERLDAIMPPATYSDNPYYFLAQAVEHYGISFEKGNMYYSIKLNESMSFAEWAQKIQQYNNGDWYNSMTVFAELIGAKFILQKYR